MTDVNYYYPYYQQPMPDQLAQLRQQQYMPQMQAQTPVQQNQNPSIQWVPDERAAYEYLVAPNSAVALWDSNNPVVYLKQADASGKPTIKIFDLVERVEPSRAATAPAVEYATKKELADLAARLDALAKSKEGAENA